MINFETGTKILNYIIKGKKNHDNNVDKTINF